MTANNNRHAGPGKPSLIESQGMNVKFLIINRPAQATLPQFIKVSWIDESVILVWENVNKYQMLNKYHMLLFLF